jgi:tight adherence protein B
MTMLAILAFLAGVSAIYAGYVAVTFLPGMLAGRKLEQRLRDVSSFDDPAAGEGDSTVVKHKADGAVPGMDRLVSGTRVGSWLSRLIEQSGVNTTAGSIGVISIGIGIAVGLMTALFVPQPMAAIAAGVFGAICPTLWLMHRRGSRFKKFEEHFPEALDLLSRAIRAGHAFQTAMGMVADELPEPVGPEFKKTFDQQNYGLPLRDALNDMAERISLLDVKFFVTAVLIQRDTGGNLSEILDNLGHVVRERFKIRRQVRVHTAHGRFTGYVLLGLPAALAVALSFINPDHMRMLFREPMGQMMLMSAIVMQTIGFFWIRQVIKIEV